MTIKSIELSYSVFYVFAYHTFSNTCTSVMWGYFPECYGYSCIRWHLNNLASWGCFLVASLLTNNDWALQPFLPRRINSDLSYDFPFSKSVLGLRICGASTFLIKPGGNCWRGSEVVRKGMKKTQAEGPWLHEYLLPRLKVSVFAHSRITAVFW